MTPAEAEALGRRYLAAGGTWRAGMVDIPKPGHDPFRVSDTRMDDRFTPPICDGGRGGGGYLGGGAVVTIDQYAVDVANARAALAAAEADLTAAEMNEHIARDAVVVARRVERRAPFAHTGSPRMHVTPRRMSWWPPSWRLTLC